MMHQDQVPEEIRQAITAFLEQEVGSYGFRSVSIEAGRDADGDPVLFIDADYENSAEPIDPQSLAHLVTKLRALLWDMGETRFPHVTHEFNENQKILGIR